MWYFAELLVGMQFTLGGSLCEKVTSRAYKVVGSGQSVVVGNKYFKVYR